MRTEPAVGTSLEDEDEACGKYSRTGRCLSAVPCGFNNFWLIGLNCAGLCSLTASHSCSESSLLRDMTVLPVPFLRKSAYSTSAGCLQRMVNSYLFDAINECIMQHFTLQVEFQELLRRQFCEMNSQLPR